MVAPATGRAFARIGKFVARPRTRAAWVERYATQGEGTFRGGAEGVLAAGCRQPAGRSRLRHRDLGAIDRKAADARRAEALSRGKAAGPRTERGRRPCGEERARGGKRRDRLRHWRHDGALRALLQPAARGGNYRVYYARARRHSAHGGMSACARDRSAAAGAGGMEGGRRNAASDSARGAVRRSARSLGSDVEGDRVCRGEYLDR